jgi:cytochrome c6
LNHRLHVSLATILAATGIVFLATSNASAMQAPAASAPPPAAAIEIFKSQCALCHGPNGTGSDTGKALKVKDLTSKEVQDEKDETMKHVITAGKGNMPPFTDRFSPETLDGLIKVVRSFAKVKPTAAQK